MYQLNDPTHARTLGCVRYIYIGSAADGGLIILNIVFFKDYIRI